MYVECTCVGSHGCTLSVHGVMCCQPWMYAERAWSDVLVAMDLLWSVLGVMCW